MPDRSPSPSENGLSEDWLAVLLGAALLACCLAAVLLTPEFANPLKPWLAKPGGWSASPTEAFDQQGIGVLGATVVLLVGFTLVGGLRQVGRFVPALVGVFLLATLAMLLAKQAVADSLGLGYALWAIVLGLVIANTVGAPAWLRPAVRTELFMKVGLVLLGAEVLFGRLLALGLPGVCIAWIVTPVVLCTTFWFGQRVLKIDSPSLNMVISADMSVCGVSAAIATSAACRAKKEELSLAVGMSMLFTVVMMVVMPFVVRWLGLGPVVGGAWIGGTIDATGAVAAAGVELGEDALQVAATIKMIQNILIGVVAFAVATYWVTRVEAAGTKEDQASGAPRPGVGEIWRRFPKFILGFIGASIVFSLIHQYSADGEAITKSTIGGATKTLRTWCFCLAFVSIGLETRFRELAGVLQSGKPLVLYVCGQALNLVLTLAMALLVFRVLFPEAGT